MEEDPRTKLQSSSPGPYGVPQIDYDIIVAYIKGGRLPEFAPPEVYLDSSKGGLNRLKYWRQQHNDRNYQLFENADGTSVRFSSSHVSCFSYCFLYIELTVTTSTCP